jgi:hypothetical protein
VLISWFRMFLLPLHLAPVFCDTKSLRCTFVLFFSRSPHDPLCYVWWVCR